MTGDNNALYTEEVVPFGEEKNLKPRSENRILLRDSFQNVRRVPPPVFFR